jgi:hypothetical protein
MKVANAAAAGALAALIYNNSPGFFNGTGNQPQNIPALALSGAVGTELLGLSGVTVHVNVPFAVPGPIAGVGIPGLLTAIVAFLEWWRRRRIALQ